MDTENPDFYRDNNPTLGRTPEVIDPLAWRRDGHFASPGGREIKRHAGSD